MAKASQKAGSQKSGSPKIGPDLSGPVKTKTKKASDLQSPSLKAFKERIGEIQDLRTTQGLLGWDLEVFMPEKGSAVRSSQLSTLAKLSHEMLVSEETGTLLKELRAPEVLKGLSKVEQAMVREVGKEYDRQQKIPTQLVQEMTQTTAEAMPLWAEARKKSDFKLFAPILTKIIEQNQRMAEAIGYEKSPYNALLDLYEPNLTVAQIDPLFKDLKAEIVPLLQAIQNAKAPETKFLHKKYDTQSQLAFSKVVVEAMGFDLKAGRLDLSVHPFSMGISPDDVRLTTRVFERDLFSCLASALHEAGHGLYEQGSQPELIRTTLEGGTSLGIHESQSRMWENIVGRSRPFWKHFYPKLKKAFPGKLDGVKLEAFYKAINRVQSSPIRVEADEVTYNLHIMLRYGIEKDLIEGKMKVKDIPEIWNEQMKTLLGYSPKNDAEGCLQDVHWSHGSFGYFPTYTLGNLYSAMFFEMATKQINDLSRQIEKGNLSPLTAWLKQEIHWVGKMESPDEISRRVTGQSLTAKPFVNYLWAKYGELYGIQRK
jgi:carboxypeptidase Taq